MKWKKSGSGKGSDAVRSFLLARKRIVNCIAGPLERLIAVQIFAASFVKALLVFNTAFVVCAEVGSAVLDLVPSAVPHTENGMNPENPARKTAAVRQV